MKIYISPAWQRLLQFNNLADFEKIWSCEVEWVEAPNDGRGGLSGVGRVYLNCLDGTQLTAYLKRQQNHIRKSWRYPVRGEATFGREFKLIRQLQKADVGTLEPMFFAEDYASGYARALLMTVELTGYLPLDEFAATDRFKNLALSEKRFLLQCVARTVKRMHDAGVQHRSLYAKHIFVKPVENNYQIAIIDLEKSRVSKLLFLRRFYDLVTLNYRTEGWTCSSRLYFFKQYYGIQSIGFWHKWLCKMINKRSVRKWKVK